MIIKTNQQVIQEVDFTVGSVDDHDLYGKSPFGIALIYSMAHKLVSEMGGYRRRLRELDTYVYTEHESRLGLFYCWRTGDRFFNMCIDKVSASLKDGQIDLYREYDKLFRASIYKTYPSLYDDWAVYIDGTFYGELIDEINKWEKASIPGVPTGFTKGYSISLCNFPPVSF